VTEEPLWHCTLADKAAMDANLLRVEAEREALRKALTDLLNDSGIEFDDERLDYLVIQVDRRAWNAARAVLTEPEEADQ
jgi:ribosomal protein L12E/L44/L45/RPP1/RPP2